MRVVVLGAGIVGASAAFHLAEAGADVVVVDDARAGRATRAGAGIVDFPWPEDGAAALGFELAAAAYAAYPALIERLDLDRGVARGFDLIGQLYVDPPGPLLDSLHERLTTFCRASGRRPGGVDMLDPAETSACFPYLRDDLAAVRIDGTARVDGEAVRRALRRTAERLGAAFISGRAALHLDANRSAQVLVGGRRLAAEAVVVAAGAWSSELFEVLGVRLAVGAQRGQLLHLVLPGADTSHLPVIQAAGAHNYLLPFPGGRIVAGATRESESGLDPRLTAGGVAVVLHEALSIAPGVAVASLSELRVGLRPVTPDGQPLLGPVPGCRGVFVATGMGSQGLAVGPYCGALVAELALGATPSLDIAKFAPDRHFS